MEKSIESIWKEGFLQDDALVAPKLNDLYNQKSIDLIEKFESRYRINHRGLVIFAIFTLIVSFPIGMQYMGVPIFFIFIGLVIFSKKQLDSIQDFDRNKSSYEYLKSYRGWLQKRISVFKKVNQYIYPLIFLSTVVGFWFLDIGDRGRLGEYLVGWLQTEFIGTYVMNVILLLGVLLLLITTGLISFFSSRFYDSDFQALYGSLMERLDELISDMEELNSSGDSSSK